MCWLTKGPYRYLQLPDKAYVPLFKAPALSELELDTTGILDTEYSQLYENTLKSVSPEAEAVQANDEDEIVEEDDGELYAEITSADEPF